MSDRNLMAFVCLTLSLTDVVDYGEYSPELPYEHAVPAEFGRGEVLQVEGRVHEKRFFYALPVVKLRDNLGRMALECKIEPDFALLLCTSDFGTVI
jgi:hypothetical protein